MFLAQGPQRSDAGEAWTLSLSVSSQALYHWATALPMYVLKCGGSLCWIYLIFLKYPIKMKLFGLTKTKLFHFQRIFKNGGGAQRGSPLDPPLHLFKTNGLFLLFWHIKLWMVHSIHCILYQGVTVYSFLIKKYIFAEDNFCLSKQFRPWWNAA